MDVNQCLMFVLSVLQISPVVATSPCEGLLCRKFVRNEVREAMFCQKVGDGGYNNFARLSLLDDCRMGCLILFFVIS